jgi:Tol biopolymer transport system component
MLAVARADDDGFFEIWSYDLARGGLDTRVSSFSFVAPVWSPDGETLIAGAGDLALFRLGRPGSEPAPTAGGANQFSDWSPDGKTLLGARADGSGADLYAWPVDGSAAVAVATGKGRQSRGAFAPNGAWIAFEADDGGTNRIYVTSFPEPGARIPVARINGAQPRWRQDGRELFYIGPGHEVIAVPVTWPAKGPPEFGDPRRLFPIPGLVRSNGIFDVTPDGQRFVAVVEGDADRTPIMVRVRTPSK